MRALGRDPGPLRTFLVRLDDEQLLPEMRDRLSISGLFPGRPHINLRERRCDFATLRLCLPSLSEWQSMPGESSVSQAPGPPGLECAGQLLIFGACPFCNVWGRKQGFQRGRVSKDEVSIIHACFLRLCDCRRKVGGLPKRTRPNLEMGFRLAERATRTKEQAS